jgi:hypothetical protein
MSKENQRRIVLRIPEDLHIRLCEQANRLKVSLNWLCSAKVQQDLGPTELPKSKRRGRVPGKKNATTEKQVPPA